MIILVTDIDGSRLCHLRACAPDGGGHARPLAGGATASLREPFEVAPLPLMHDDRRMLRKPVVATGPHRAPS